MALDYGETSIGLDGMAMVFNGIHPSTGQTINGTKASFMSTQYLPSLAQSPRPRFIAFNYLHFPKMSTLAPQLCAQLHFVFYQSAHSAEVYL